MTQIIPELLDIYNDRLFIYDEPPYTTSHLGKIVANTRPDLLIIDHLGYVDETADNIVQRLGKITKWAKRIAKKTNCHAMVLCQLNRGVESRDNKAPILSDLRDSGNIEEDADMVLMPYRPAYYADNPVPMRYSETHLFIRKNRDGPLGAVGIYLDMLHQWFYRKDELPQNYSNIKL
jgi:replicative DNA helicase